MSPAWAVLAILAVSPNTGSDCSDAIDKYNQALDDVSYALKRYTNCLSSSQGKDDCSMEFRRLKNAQYDIETAVSEIGSYCDG